MKTIILSILLVIALVACGGGRRSTPPDEGQTFAVVLVDGDGNCPSYYILTSEDQTIYVYADVLSSEILDGFVFLTWEEIEEVGLLEVPICNPNCEDEDDNRGHGNDCDRDDEDNPAND